MRATAVACHKNHLFYAYRTSLQHSSIANPYVWSAVFGAAELSMGDTITNLVPIGGSEANAALMVVCQNALSVLYGNSAADPWNPVPLSKVSGGQARSAQDIGGLVAFDTPGVTRYPATKSFGNFEWDVVSLSIQPIVRNQAVTCSVFVPGLFKYRIFFEDGSAISGLPEVWQKAIDATAGWSVDLVDDHVAEHDDRVEARAQQRTSGADPLARARGTELRASADPVVQQFIAGRSQGPMDTPGF